MDEKLIAAHAPWVVPLVIFLLQTGLKLLIAEQFQGNKLWVAILQSPVEIGFLGLSFMATILVSEPSKVIPAIISCFIYLIILLVSITIWKVSPSGPIRADVIKSSLLGFLNFAITLPMLVFSILMLTGRAI
ncbi:hypothetical protein [Shewanella algae]|uniref:hypothetical protein n=1 Tax=Shewanella algae TaxID=38313 RepID=UPI000E1B8CF4|nr:hypothetical protein [Shewanella algae]MBO2557603.1 hypothetical protein [Shewanella algae]MBO2574539.1 hypothetical protein [Shewanella algae]MBO2608566.1 hypothetical protein [Shewanella algae]